MGMTDHKSSKRPKMHSPSAKPDKPNARLGRDVQTKIGQQLRAMYDEVVSEGVPDRFVDLLRKLEKRSDKDA
jgi:hypothetical protein